MNTTTNEGSHVKTWLPSCTYLINKFWYHVPMSTVSTKLYNADTALKGAI